MEEAAQALEKAKEQGITAMILTPHFYPDGQGVTKEQVMEGLEQLRPLAESLGISLYPGMECYYHTNLPSQLEEGQALTLAGSRYVLVEFSEHIGFWKLLYALNDITERGFVPVVAHYERYKCLMNRSNMRRVKQEGYLLQLNFDTVQRTYGILQHNPFLGHLRGGMVDFMGSDCHGTHFRPLRITPSVDWLEKHGCLDRLEENAQKVLRNEY